MKPEEIKAKVQGAYLKAVENRSVQSFRSSNLHNIFRDVTLYGSEAGIDFVETHIDQIVREAVEMAECKDRALEMVVHRCGRAALDGIAKTLRGCTDLKVEVEGSTIRLIWSEANPGLV